MDMNHPGAQLAEFAAALRFDAIPSQVVNRSEELLLDWVGSALAGKGARPVETIARFLRSQGPEHGPAELLISRHGTSPLLAARINAAASHVAEQDDVHTARCSTRRPLCSGRPWRWPRLWSARAAS